MNFTKKVTVSVLFSVITGVFLYGATKSSSEPTKQQEINFEVRGDSEVCETEYDKCTANCEIKSKTEKAFDACMEACEDKYDVCYEKESQKPKN